MYGISIEDSPDAPVGTPATRRTIAIHWNWVSEYTHAEIADALGVTEQTVKRYLQDGPNQEVRDLMNDIESQVRLVAVAELKEQLRAAGSRSRTAEKPVKIYKNEDGEVEVRDVRDEDTGELVTKKPIPQDIQLMPDEQARYYARAEARDILEQLIDITGAGEPDQVEVEGSGIVIHTEAKDG